MSVTTTIEQQNTETVRRGFKAFASGDMQTLNSLFHEDAEFHTVPAGVVKEAHCRGRGAIFEMFALLKKETNGTFAPRAVTHAASGDEVFVRSEATGERNGHKLTIDEVLLFRLAGGRVKDVRVYINDPPEYMRAWS